MTIRLGTDVVCWSMQEVLSYLKPGTLFSIRYDPESDRSGNNNNSFVALLENVERGYKGYDKWSVNLGKDEPFNVLLMFVYKKPSPCFLYQNKLVRFNLGSSIQVFQNNCFVELTILS